MSVFDNLLKKNESKILTGLNNELKGLFVYNKFVETDKSIFFITSSLYEANILYQIIKTYTTEVVLFPMDDFLTSEALAISPEFKYNRLDTISSVLEGKKIILTNLMGYLRYLPPKDVFINSIINIRLNDEYNINSLINNLYFLGYTRESIVNKTGEFAVRGFVLDVFPLKSNNPIRIEFWGDSVDSIREFSIDSQLTIKKIENVKVLPNTELLVKDKNIPYRDIVKYYSPCSISDYLSDKIIVFNDFNSIISNYKQLQTEMLEYKKNNNLSLKTKFMFDLDTTFDSRNYYLMNFDNKYETATNYSVYSLDNFHGTIDDINRSLNNYLKQKYIIVICLSNKYKINRLIKDLDNDNIVYTDANNILEDKINIIEKELNSGYIIDGYIFISEKELYNKKNINVTYKTNFKIGTKIRDINRLQIGDYIVHSMYGIGIYQGIKTLKKNGLDKDYLQLEYKDGDKLYIPVEKIALISKYNGSDGFVPKLNKLGGVEWSKTKLRIKKKIESIAGDLLKLYAKREKEIGFAFKKDDENQVEFEKEFKYEETIDQLRVTNEIKKDMEKPQPMDRLLCGDVGYGKTEVAFRAAFKAILSGKQVALLCPTTILSMQHFNNAIERFSSFPVEISLLNRFINKKQQQKILDNVKTGGVDFLIGTHRILSDDVQFKNLGLLIIDEEQRFGVKHKEKIKQYKSNIDVLTLSATPIPRTLQMSMAGVLNLSLIETAPMNRYPVQTYVLEENKQIIKDAIYKELSREGQVFLLNNSIEQMESKVSEIQNLVPEAKIVYAHGRMNKNELEQIMLDFHNKVYDVLICTTIIETGIDIPSVNTLIIIDADKYGLAQLYQIRGRVGRSNKIAYCYLMYKKGRILSDIAQKRLGAIKEFTELGSGLSIAMRDLFIRGAGDILGSEQSGFVNSVGISLFLKLLNEEVNKLQGNVVDKEIDDKYPLIEVSTSISDNYVEDENIKIEIHQKICNISTEKELLIVKNELEDRFGKLNEELIIYMYEVLFEHIANSLNITKIVQTKNFISVTIPSNLSNEIDGDKLFTSVYNLNRKFRFSMKEKTLIITLDTINLDKHYIYYLIELLYIIEQSKKTSL